MKKITKAVLPVAGLGTRFLPATKAIPKEMLPVLTKPLLQYAVEEALSANIQTMAIVTGRGKRAIEDHFDHSFELESQLAGTNKESYLENINAIINKATFTYVRQQKMLGLGDAILTGEPLIGDETFAVILADDLCDNNENSVLSQMVELYNKYKCPIIGIEEVPIEETHKYGIVEGSPINNNEDLLEITNMIEKPKFGTSSSNLAIIGRYILTPQIFRILKGMRSINSNEIQITDAIFKQAKNERVLAYKFKGKRFDCGEIKGHLMASNYFAKK